MSSGGSFVSVSEIWSADTVTVQVVLYGSGEDGVSVKVVAGAALCPNDCGTPAGHWIENAVELAVTLSLKLMTIGELTGTFGAPFAGVVLGHRRRRVGGTRRREGEGEVRRHRVGRIGRVGVGDLTGRHLHGARRAGRQRRASASA